MSVAAAAYRGAIADAALAGSRDRPRHRGEPWQTALLCFGYGHRHRRLPLERQPWYVSAKQWAATWLVEHDIMWPLLDNAPWFILTHYPEVNDSFSWLDGAGILMFVVGATICVGGAAYLSLWIADRIAPAPAVPGAAATRWGRPGLHKLAQALIPSAGIGVFLACRPPRSTCSSMKACRRAGPRRCASRC